VTSPLSPDLDRLDRLVQSIAGARTFEQAAQSTLRALDQAATEVIEESDYAEKARLLRGMVHLRPGDGYRGLVVVPHTDEGEGAPSVAPASEVPCVPSATAWRWVSKHGCPVAIDVELGTIAIDLDPDAPVARQRAGEGRAIEGKPFDSQESRIRMLGREATHVLVLPLRTPGGRIDGMIAIEALCRSAIGRTFVWGALRERAELIAAAAAPYLAALPITGAGRESRDELLPVVGPSMAGIVDVLRVFARQDETILLVGPTGVGKTRLARWCHAQSPWRDGPFEVLDLSAVPEELQLAELFGWKKGAFTGAIKDTVGAVTRANDGTLFIDEIDKLSLKAQAGLLRVLEERRFRPLGEGATERNATLRFVVATNADLPAAVKAGTFREDLYYRIHVLPVRVPPLAERTDEIAAWADYMIERRHRSAGAGGGAKIHDDAKTLLAQHGWPGNLRQLDNIVRRAYALALLDQAGKSDLALGLAHLQRALAYESGESNASLVDQLERAASAFVAEAERRKSQGGLDLDLVDALRGFVLAAATEKLGGKDAAFRLVGKESVVQNRNHAKAFRKELERVDALCKALGAQNPFAALLASDE
jgi:DNA-binding NtrC family response regulator